MNEASRARLAALPDPAAAARLLAALRAAAAFEDWRPDVDATAAGEEAVSGAASPWCRLRNQDKGGRTLKVTPGRIVRIEAWAD